MRFWIRLILQSRFIVANSENLLKMSMPKPNQVAVRDLVEEAKKRIVILIVCVVGLSYLMSCKWKEFINFRFASIECVYYAISYFMFFVLFRLNFICFGNCLLNFFESIIIALVGLKLWITYMYTWLDTTLTRDASDTGNKWRKWNNWM